MDNQEIRARAFEIAIKMIKPEEINISRDDEQGDICLSRPLYDTFVSVIRLIKGEIGNTHIIKGAACIYPAENSE
jgi:hypothetical protein